ncbi:hypothetical protein Bhyg_11410 [Pseudolycoriella hygida]|uniref:Uncharacterized protein n=1 Tax=Pseudolycoriella hygida TaxID=35572 RepID=A0A9Q0S098_9DIPT|nr:hypothetical protein Bhyg_11410 [Pseudolycoriella hygida]
MTQKKYRREICCNAKKSLKDFSMIKAINKNYTLNDRKTFEKVFHSSEQWRIMRKQLDLAPRRTVELRVHLHISETINTYFISQLKVQTSVTVHVQDIDSLPQFGKCTHKEPGTDLRMGFYSNDSSVYQHQRTKSTFEKQGYQGSGLGPGDSYVIEHFVITTHRTYSQLTKKQFSRTIRNYLKLILESSKVRQTFRDRFVFRWFSIAYVPIISATSALIFCHNHNLYFVVATGKLIFCYEISHCQKLEQKFVSLFISFGKLLKASRPLKKMLAADNDFEVLEFVHFFNINAINRNFVNISIQRFSHLVTRSRSSFIFAKASFTFFALMYKRVSSKKYKNETIETLSKYCFPLQAYNIKMQFYDQARSSANVLEQILKITGNAKSVLCQKNLNDSVGALSSERSNIQLGNSLLLELGIEIPKKCRLVFGNGQRTVLDYEKDVSSMIEFSVFYWLGILKYAFNTTICCGKKFRQFGASLKWHPEMSQFEGFEADISAVGKMLGRLKCRLLLASSLSFYGFSSRFNFFSKISRDVKPFFSRLRIKRWQVALLDQQVSPAAGIDVAHISSKRTVEITFNIVWDVKKKDVSKSCTALFTTSFMNSP